MSNLILSSERFCNYVFVLFFGSIVSAFIAPPTVAISTLLTSLNDTISVHAQTATSYAPSYTICTSQSLIRRGNYLGRPSNFPYFSTNAKSPSILESEYVQERNKQARKFLVGFLTRQNLNGSSELFETQSAVIGLAFSGGGYRSMLSGAGVLSAMDAKTEESVQHLGGILQSSTYIAGNSGGLWLVANNLLNDGIPIYEAIRKQSFASPLIEGIPDVPISQLRATLDAQTMVDQNSSVWNTYSKLLTETEPEKGSLTSTLIDTFFKTKDSEDIALLNITSSNSRKSLDFYKDLNIEVRTKKKSGFQVSLIDYWGRAVSKKIFPPGKKSVDLCMSSVTELPSFENFSQLFPIFGSVERLPGKSESSIESHLFEFNPFEFGSWDSNLNSFVDIKFLGTELSNGKSTVRTKNEDYSVCVSGYDNMGLITGTSSGLFNTVFQYAYKMILQMEEKSSSLLSMVFKIFGITSHPKPDTFMHPEYAVYSPNPFKGVVPPMSKGRLISDTLSIFLADGGDDGQNIPFHPLLVKGRQVEVIFAFDATSDYENLPNGTTLAQTAKRYHSYDSSLRLPVFAHLGKARRVFPHVPTPSMFREAKLGSHPIFLGCEISRDFPQVNLSEITKHSNESSKIHAQHDTLVLQDFELRFEIWEGYQPPIIIYFANHDHSYPSNTSTFRTVYSTDEVGQMLENGYNVATNKNDLEYMRCVGCALIKRRADLSISPDKYLQDCAECFLKFCYVEPS